MLSILRTEEEGKEKKHCFCPSGTVNVRRNDRTRKEEKEKHHTFTEETINLKGSTGRRKVQEESNRGKIKSSILIATSVEKERKKGGLFFLGRKGS